MKDVLFLLFVWRFNTLPYLFHYPCQPIGREKIPSSFENYLDFFAPGFESCVSPIVLLFHELLLRPIIFNPPPPPPPDDTWCFLMENVLLGIT